MRHDAIKRIEQPRLQADKTPHCIDHPIPETGASHHLRFQESAVDRIGERFRHHFMRVGYPGMIACILKLIIDASHGCCCSTVTFQSPVHYRVHHFVDGRHCGIRRIIEC